MTDDAHVPLRIDTEIDRESIARRHRRRARRPPKRSDRWWAIGAGLVSLAGWAATGPHFLWYAGLAAAALFLVGDVVERRTVSRELAAIPPGRRRRTIEVSGRGVRVVAADGAVLGDATWREVEGVSLRDGAYLLELDDGVHDLPVEDFPTEVSRGSFEAIAARNGKPVHRG